MIQSQQVQEWQAEARAEGEVKGKAETLLEVLELKFGPVPADLAVAVRARSDLARLKGWVAAAVRAPSLAEFRQDAQI